MKTTDIFRMSAESSGEVSFADVRTSGKEFMSTLGLSKVKLLILISHTSVFLANYIEPQTTMVAALQDMKDYAKTCEWARLFYKQLSQGISVSQACTKAASSTSMPVAAIMRESADWTFKA
jgi:hypothetical protein